MSNSSSKTHNIPNKIFQLLVPTCLDSPIELQGRHWTLTKLAPIPKTKDKYICVSYVWGEKKTVNPFDKHKQQLMSARTISALEATIRTRRVRQPAAIWIDALCVPFQGPERKACLASMGAIYSKALQVVVVLSDKCSNLLEQIYRTGRIDIEMLSALEQDEWVTRAWTYQEIANGKSIDFIVEQGSDVSISGNQFLNCVGQANNQYRKTHGYDLFVKQYPHLDSLENTLLDWMTADYLKRSAYQAMSAMVRREATREEDRSYAMVGALTTTPAYDMDTQTIHPAEYFMQVCEAKGDYSFIYSTNPRREVPGKCWRPVADYDQADSTKPKPIHLHPIFPWPSDGQGQSGCIYPTHLQLNNMCRMRFGSVSPTARQFIDEWLQSDNAISLSDTIPTRILRRLKDAGFSECQAPLELESGYFFPQSQITDLDEVFVVVATEVRWVHGAPGLLVRGKDTDIPLLSLSGILTNFRDYSQGHLTKESGFNPHFSESDRRGIYEYRADHLSNPMDYCEGESSWIPLFGKER